MEYWQGMGMREGRRKKARGAYCAAGFSGLLAAGGGIAQTVPESP
jgi:hypothetical protein